MCVVCGGQSKVEMYSKYERQKDKRSYVDRKVIYTGPQYCSPAERIQPTKCVKWSEEGLPTYEEPPAGGFPEPAPVQEYAPAEYAPADEVVVA